MVGLVTHGFSATQAEATTNSAGSTTAWVGPNEWNGAHNQSITITGSTAGVSSGSGTNQMIGASQNLTASIDGSGNVWLNGPQLSAFEVGWGSTNTGTAAKSPTDATSLGASSNNMFGALFVLPTELAMQRLDFFGSVALTCPSFAASTSSTHTTNSSGFTVLQAGLFSRGTGTATGTLFLMSSASLQVSYSATMTGSSISESATVSLTWSTGIPLSSISATYSGSKNATATTGQNTMLTSGNTGSWGTVTAGGAFDLPMPFAGTLEPGEYFLGLQVATAGNTAAGPRASFYFASAFSAALTMGYFGAVGGGTPPGGEYIQGLMMTSSTSTVPAAYTMSNLVPSGQGQPLAQLVNYGTATNLL